MFQHAMCILIPGLQALGEPFIFFVIRPLVRCPLAAVSQPGRMETSFLWATFSRPLSVWSGQCCP